MAIESQKIVTVGSYPGQILQQLPSSDTRAADNFEIFDGASGDKFADISGRTVHTTIDKIRLMGANGIPDAGVNIQYLTNDYDCPGTWVVDGSDTTSTDNTGTLLVTAGGTRLKRKFDKVINSQWFGTTGDGETDDTTALQSSIAAAEGYTLQIPEGKYSIDPSHPLDIPNNIYIQLHKNATLIIADTTLTNYSIFKIIGRSNIVISGGQFNGGRDGHTGTTGQSGHCILIQQSDNITIKNCYLYKAWADGIYIGSASGTTVCTNILIDNIISDGNRRQGCSITYCDGIKITNSKFINTSGTNPSAGIDIEPNAGTYVKNVFVDNCDFNGNVLGLNLSSGNGSINNLFATNINCYNNSSYGIHTGGANNCINININGFIIDSCAGIDIRNTQKSNILNGQVINTDITIGFNFTNNSNLLISQCLFDTAKFISIDNNDGLQIIGNTIQNMASDSILCGSLSVNSNIIIKGNLFYNSTNRHINLRALTNSKITENIFNESGFDSILLRESSNGNIIENNKCIGAGKSRSNLDYAVNLSSCNNNHIANNTMIKGDGNPGYFSLFDADCSGNNLVNNSHVGQTGLGDYNILNSDNKVSDFLLKVRSITAASTQVLSDRVILIENTVQPIIFTLLSPDLWTKQLTIKNKSTSTKTVTIQGDGTINIDGSNTLILPAGYSVELSSDLIKYYIVSIYSGSFIPTLDEVLNSGKITTQTPTVGGVKITSLLSKSYLGTDSDGNIIEATAPTTDYIKGGGLFSGDGTTTEFTVTYDTALSAAAAQISITPETSDAAAAQFYISSSSLTGFTIKAAGTVPPSGTNNVSINYVAYKS